MRTAEEAKSYLESLGKRAGLADEAIKALLNNAEVVKDAQDHLARQDELSSKLDTMRNEVNTAKGQYEQAHRQITEWYEKTGLPAFQASQKATEDLQRYRSTFGDLPNDPNNNSGGNAPRDPNTGKFVSREDLNAVGLSAIQVGKQMAFITSDYNQRFAGKFGALSWDQMEEFEKFAVSRETTPIDAYRQWIKPKEDQIAEEAKKAADAANEAKIKAAYDQGMKDGRTKQQWAGETTRTTDPYGVDLEARKGFSTDPDAQQKSADQAFLDVMAEDWSSRGSNAA